MEIEVNEAIIKIRKRFLQRQAALVSKYDLFLAELREGKASAEHTQETRDHIHRTAGTAAAFEFMDLSSQSMMLEDQFELLIAKKDADKAKTIIIDALPTYINEIKRLTKEFIDLDLDNQQ